MTIPSWVYFQAAFLVALVVAAFVIAVGWMVVTQSVGRARARARDYAGAARWYGLAFNHAVRMAGSLNIAVAQLQAGDPETAERTLRMVWEDARRRRDRRLERYALLNLGAALIAQRRLGEATPILAWAAQGKASAPERVTAMHNLAWVAFLERDFEQVRLWNAAAQLAAPRTPANLAAVEALVQGRLATREGRFEEARAALAEAATAASRSPDRGLPNQVRLAQGTLDYLAGNREPGLATVLAAAAAVEGPDRRDLAGRWLSGLAFLARRQGDEAGAARLEAATPGLRGRMPLPPPEDCAVYLKA